MKHIELQYPNNVSVDMLETILKEKFPNKKLKRQNWGVNSPFLWLKINFWIRVAVAIKQRPKKLQTTVIVNDNMTVTAVLLFGWIPYFIFRKHHRKNVMAAVRDGIREKTNVFVKPNEQSEARFDSAMARKGA